MLAAAIVRNGLLPDMSHLAEPRSATGRRRTHRERPERAQNGHLVPRPKRCLSRNTSEQLPGKYKGTHEDVPPTSSSIGAFFWEDC